VSLLHRLQGLPAGHRAKWVVLVLWIAAAAGFGSVSGKLHDATVNDPQAFLPSDAQSTRVAAIQAKEFPEQSSSSEALVVYQNASGLSQADRQAIEADVEKLSRPGVLENVDAIVSPFSKQGQEAGLVSSDGTTAIVPVQVNSTDIQVVKPVVETIRDIVQASPPSGLDVYVTGTAGLEVDGFDILGNLDATLLLATVVLIVVLLVLIYRSVFVTLVPLLTVAFAYAVASGVVYLLIEGLGLTVTSEATSLLIILMFGAGTDYCIYLLARYREELREMVDKHEAMRQALRGASPAILSCGLTVAGAMLVLMVADLQSTKNAGPVLAIGIGVMMVAGLTLLPALLAILGRLAFWPRAPQPGTAVASAPGLYHRIGQFVVRRPIPVLTACVAALAVLAGGTAIRLGDISVFEGFRERTDAIAGQEALARAFPPGETAPTAVIVEAPNASLERASQAVAASLRNAPGVGDVRPAGTNEAGDVAQLDVVLAEDPYSDAAADLVPELRTRAESAAAAANGTALVGGPTAAQYDTDRTIASDFELIFPITLVLIFLILVALLRALVAPVYLIATVVLSFFATLGLSYFAFRYLFDSGGLTSGYSTFLFIFLVALGVDYNIFLMSRIREEAGRLEPREAVLHGLETTGGVITSAGIILAGTFACLMIVPLEQLFQLGFGIAVGVLLDTFVVRTLLVPAITDLLGRRAWWPGHAERGGADTASIVSGRPGYE
jgi:RND superfamily putative drug exporter